VKKNKIKIVEFYLKNYAPFYESMGLHEFYFNKRDAPYDITLIIAQNGIGKSFLITELSPELLEHIAGRIANRFLPGLEGEKRIRYLVDGAAEYDCRIYYSKDHKASCYFKEVGLAGGEERELNPNGNVASYLELCRHYLYYNKTYKNVGYITDNVRNVVTMPFSERQQLFSAWIPDTSRFLSASKTVQKKANSARKEIEALTSDITKISISSYKENLANLKANLAAVEKELLFYRDHISKTSLLLQSAFGRFEKGLLKERVGSFKKRAAGYEKSVQGSRELFNKYKNYLSGGGEAGLLKDISLLKERKAVLENSLEGINDKITAARNAADRLRSREGPEGRPAGGEQDIVSVDGAINSLKQSLLAAEGNIREALDGHPEFAGICYSGELKDAVKQTMAVLLSIYQTASGIIQACDGFSLDDLFAENSAVISNYRAATGALHEQNRVLEESVRTLHENEEAASKLRVDESFLSFIPEACGGSACALVRELRKHMHAGAAGLREEIERKENLLNENKEKLSALNLKIAAIEGIILGVTRINNVLFGHKQKIALLPEHIFEQVNTPDIAKFIASINTIIKDLQEADEYVALLEKEKACVESIKNLRNVYSLLKAGSSLNGELAARLEEEKKLLEEREKISGGLAAARGELERLSDLSRTIAGLLEEKAKAENERKELENEREKLGEENKKLYQKTVLQEALGAFKNKESGLVKNEFLARSEIEKCAAMITNRKVLEQRKEAFEKKLKLYELLYAAWNSRTGYPSMLIKEFLDEVTFVTNASLDNIWGGLIRIKEFVLSENEFSIPIIRGNTVLGDICECSTAEKNTLSLAISLAIIQASTSYNVIRIDEADSGFDDMRRQTFLDMVTRQLDEAGCGDCYIVTHNQFFENVPCNVILLKGYSRLVSEASLENKYVLYRYPSL
jgi:DNA repair exonuclease SbcCD ATPase subunit